MCGVGHAGLIKTVFKLCKVIDGSPFGLYSAVLGPMFITVVCGVDRFLYMDITMPVLLSLVFKYLDRLYSVSPLSFIGLNEHNGEENDHGRR